MRPPRSASRARSSASSTASSARSWAWVAPRGRTQWVRNAEAANEVALKRGSTRRRFGLRALADADKPPVLLAYLERYRSVVQRYFPVPAGSPVGAFAEIAARYPAFELVPLGETAADR